MKNNTPLKFTPKELIDLDSFLRNQTSDMTLVKAHGFITAIVSFPELFMPSEWIPVLVGDIKFLHDHTPVNIMLEKLVTIYRQIVRNFGTNSNFEFILSAEQPGLTIDKAPYASIQEWCNGYCLALIWNEHEWLNIKEDFITKACTTFFMLTEIINFTNERKKLEEWNKDKQLLIKNLPDLILALYNYWLNKQKSRAAMSNSELHLHSHNSVCPCGSKKQYHNCCYIEAAEAVFH